MKKYWLMKSEPSVYSINDLKKDKKTLWDGVRNYQARNFMIHEMKVGDEVLFYHSSAEPPGIAGLAQISAPAQADPTALDSSSKYFDPKATSKNPRWSCVEVKFKKVFKNFISIKTLRSQAFLKSMMVLKKGQRLSILPVTKKEFEYILILGSK